MNILRFFQKRKAQTVSENTIVANNTRDIKAQVRSHFYLDKRQKFVIGICVLSLLFLSIQFNVGGQDIVIVIILALLTNIFLFWAMRRDLKENMMYTIFILPFFYSLALGLFYLLIPTRILFRVILTLIYVFGLYSLYLSQNIFVVGASRTIALLTGARIVSFVITLICFVLLSNIAISLHFSIPIILFIILLCTFPLTYHSLWTYTLQKAPFRISLWSGGITICILEISAILLFWPSSPTVLALFLGSMLYIFLGMSHVWIERRLFRNVMWEFAWVLFVAFLFLITFTTWGR